MSQQPGQPIGEAGPGYTNHAWQLLRRTRRSKTGWGQKHFERLYGAFGFVGSERKKHVFYTHPDYPDLIGSVPRHNSLKDWVAEDAVKRIEEMLKRQGVTDEST